MSAPGAEKNPADRSSCEIVISRLFNAPRALVFKMSTDPKHLVHWAIPKGFYPPIIDHVDARAGGSLQMTMRCTDGNVYLSKWAFIEVDEPARLVYDEVCDENGRPFHRSRQTVEFTEHDGKTTLSVHGRIDIVPGRDPRWTLEIMKAGWAEGWGENFDLLEKYLATSPAP